MKERNKFILVIFIFLASCSSVPINQTSTPLSSVTKTPQLILETQTPIALTATCPDNVIWADNLAENYYYPEGEPQRLAEKDYPLVYDDDYFELAEKREAIFTNAITMELALEGIALRKIRKDYWISLIVRVIFTNNSPDPLVIFEPHRYSLQHIFTGFPLSLGYRNDDGSRVRLPYASFLPSMTNNPTRPENLGDFVVVNPGESFTALYSRNIGDLDNYHELFPSGKNEVWSLYMNGNVGYWAYQEFSDVPPPELEPFSDEEEAWWDAHRMHPDLNAWVGNLWSGPFEFEIPTRDELQSCINTTFAHEPQNYVWMQYPPAPEGVNEGFRFPILNSDKYALQFMTNPEKKMLWLIRQMYLGKDRVLHWNTKAVMVMPEWQDDEAFIPNGCTRGGIIDNEVFVIAKWDNTSKKLSYITSDKIVKAWKANTERETFEAIATDNIECYADNVILEN